MSTLLSRVDSIKVKLGLLVVATVLVAAVVALVGSAAGVPAWLSLPVTLLLALAVTQLLAAGMVAPLQEMTRAAQAMARGDYGARVVTTNADEVGRLARSFNAMAADLGRVDVERRDLIATVSHELRTPVAALSAQLENLADGVVEPTPERLASTLASAERLGDLLGDLLALSRLEAGVVSLDPSPVTLGPLVDECVAEVEQAGRHVKVRAAVPDDLVVAVDPARMRQLLVNVLDNAARHSPSDAEVEVVAGRTSEVWWLEVLDAGRGVAREDRERVFERFGTDPDGGGTGLGLAVSRWVARLHGGWLGFLDPEEERGGARLRLEVPVEVPVQAQRATSPADAGVSPVRVQEEEESGAVAVAVADVDPDSADTFTVLTAGRWAERRPGRAPRLVLAAASVGLLGAVTLVDHLPGLGWALVLVAAGAVAWTASHRRTARFTLLCAALATASVLGMVVHSHPAVVTVAVLSAAATFLAGVTDARTLRGILLAGAAWPASALRGLPWLGRTLQGSTGARGVAVARTAVATVVGLLVFGFLLVSADPVLTQWVGRVVPDVRIDEFVSRAFVALAVGGMTLAAAYLARNPPEVDPRPGHGIVARNRWEWVVPVLTVAAVFMVFLAVQVTTVVGGDAYVRRTVGLTYSEYARRGFFQLVLATALALVVVWSAGRRAGSSVGDRRWLRASTGLLCVLVLGVVATALGRLGVYQDAYGYTVPRVMAYLVEGWLGLVVLAVVVLGAAGRTAWVPRVALVSGAAVVVGLSWFNTGGWVADRNIDRFEATGRLDVAYLGSLGGGALPTVVDRLTPEQAACVASWGPYGGPEDPLAEGWLSWSWDRSAARTALEELGEVAVEADQCVAELG
ncbi:DUF4173 domain-containing protein [Nocardioides sp. Y6]|uniref:Signal transduction histidine-protein kinase/phosphatase MprB n=1 Tax=Nocardioides malaquae TaxID=2773426 RepID=A0ABR9RN93_9ACTN|nr:DUF4153 domain-containing protein [Nocardioides malaquae]MBE7323044.1 DUF4173 domain-containing protein [Nocardioides malaquae]